MSDAPMLDGAALERLRRIGGADLMKQMVELYLANCPARIQAMIDGAAAGDVDIVQRVAHTMKSSAGNLGAVRLQHTADELETIAAAGTIDQELVARMAREFEESAQALRRVLEDANT